VSKTLEGSNDCIAGRLKHFSSQWLNITSDYFILDSVTQYKIEFAAAFPQQESVPREICFSLPEQHIIQNELDKLLKKGVIKETTHCEGEYISTIFIRPKKDGTYRLILNLKNLNEHVEYHHFKMDTLQSAIRLMKRNCYMASVDLRDAYYSVPIDEEYQKFLRFSWRGKLFQFTCLPNGLSCAPRLFTKILKPVYATLRKQGHLNVGYIDDSYLQGDTIQECQTNVTDTCCLFTKLGFIIHPVKSVLQPVQTLVFLGFVLNSVRMTVCLPPEKIFRVKEQCSKLISSATISIQELAEAIGLLVSSFPGVLYGPLFYRHLEHDKTMALRQNKGNYQAHIKLSQDSLAELQWWCNNIETADYPICTPNAKIDVTLYTDASNKGWGAVMSGEKTGGRWTDTESDNHINCLELMAILFGLKAFCTHMKSVHIRVYSDNTTAVNYINSMGGTHSMECNSVAKEIWLFCITREIWLSAAHIPGKDNIQADKESRVFNDNKEWMLRPDIFQHVTKLWGEPTIDLFASRLNAQVACYASWRPDPGATYVDAFSISWENQFFYAFPPFSLIARCLQKISMEKAEGIIIVPVWPTQPWYSQLLHLMMDVPRTLPQSLTTLTMPGQNHKTHPLIKKMVLMACRLSGNPLKHKEFLRRLETSSYDLGGKEHKNSTRLTLRGGFLSAVNNKLITFPPLYPKY